MTRTSSAVLAVAALAVLASGCVATDAATGAPPTSPAPAAPAPSEPAAPSPSDPAVEVVAADWLAPFELELGEAWTLRGCLGDAPDICVDHRGTEVGNLELSEYPLDPEEVDGDPLAVATARAQDFLASFAEDRAEGCPDFRFEADPVTPATVGGAPGVRTGFRLLTEDGTVVEQVVNHFVVADGVVFLVTTDAYALEGGCLPGSEVSLEFEPHLLADLEPHIDAIVAGTTLPPSSRAG